LTGNPFVVPDSGSLVGSSPAEAEAVLRSAPEAVESRQASASAYEGLSASGAEGLTNGAFADSVEARDGGPPAPGPGVSVTGYPSDFTMSLLLPEGRHAVADSLAPIAVGAPSNRVPLDLGLNKSSSGFEGRTVLAPVHLPLRAGEGSSLVESGVSLTPVTQAGSPLGGAEGRVDGSSVFYGDTEDQEEGVYDVDSLFKLNTYGFSENMVLRSQRAPQNLYFRVGLPSGASLRMSADGSVQILEANEVIGVIEAPHAEDAEGANVPIVMSVSQNTIAVSVPHSAGQYRFPLFIDPTIVERGRIGAESVEIGYTWGFHAQSAAFSGSDYEVLGRGAGYYGVEDAISSSVGAGESAFFYYPTQGESRIYEIAASTEYSGYAGNHFENQLGIFNVNSKANEGETQKWIENYKASSTVCALSACEAGTVTHGVNDKSEVFYSQIAREAGPLASGTSKMSSAAVYINQEKGPSTSFIPLGEWIKAGNQFSVKLDATDPGLGISGVQFKSPSAPGWKMSGADGFTSCSGAQCEECYSESSCELRALTMNTTGLPDGEDTVEATVEDPVHLTGAATTTVKIDSTAPHNIVLSGLGAGGQIGSGEYQLKAEATDGSGTTPSSGMKSLSMSIDGREFASWPAYCSPGPCKAQSGTSTIFGHDYATGRHTVTITAKDNRGNVASESFPMVINPAGTVALGPGSVNQQSGELSLRSSDVSMPGGLSVTRSYGSQHLTSGVGGTVGTQWGLSVGGAESLVKQADGSMILNGGAGTQTIFPPNGTGGYTSPAGDANLTLSSTPCEAGQTEFMLKNATANTTTCFKVPSGGSGEVWTPHISQGAAATDTVTYSYETVEVPTGSKNMVTRPSEALAPVLSGVGPCAPELKVGCRALTFNYAASTTAKGEALSEWGDVEGDLTRVYYTAYDPVSKAMKKVEVARYLYDKQGRLRTEWDPRITPELKTYYGYDGEGHLTALTAPGQETWAFVYGTIAGDATSGAALKATQAPASEAVWSGTSVANTVAPVITGSSIPGMRMAVTEGKWSGNPVVYGYEWEDCNGAGEECTLITGATNPNYTPTSNDQWHRLAAVVTATNGGGSVSVTVLAPAKAPSYSSSFGSFGSGTGQLLEPEGGLASDASGDVWVSDTYNERLEEFNSKGEFLRTAGSAGMGAGQFGWTYGVAVDKTGNVWATDAGNNRVEEFNGKGEFLKMFGWGVLDGESKLEVCTSSCRAGIHGAGAGEFNVPEGIALDSKGDVFVADRGNHRVQEFNPELAWVRNLTQLEEHEGPFYLTVDPSNNIWVTYSWDNKIGEFNSEGKLLRTWGSSGSEPGKLSTPYGVGIGPEGNVWVPEYGNNRVQVFTPAGEYLNGFGAKGSGAGQFNQAPHGIAFTSPATVYVLDSGVYWENTGNSRVEKWTIPTGEGEARPAQPGSTVEYNVPVSGGGAPNKMGLTEVGEWGQKDPPMAASAVFPPDSPQGWPASNYKRAAVYYRDSTERTVNVAVPTGGISTSEYNEKNDVTRSLSADNRAIALKEGAKSAEVAKLLDTQSEYNAEGNELLATLGPRHTVKLSNGKEVLARSHTAYEYDLDAPSEGGPYNLVTKTTQGAETESEGEQDVRTTITSYGGQSGLGWKLRKPTSVTTNPTGLGLTRTTTYDEATGNVLETSTPAANPGRKAPTYTSTFGSFGTGNGQLREPEGGLATDASGDVWVSDTYNERLEEFNSKGEFLRTAGSAGMGAGQFGWTYGVAVDKTGNVWATDAGNNRVEEFNGKGEFLKMFGWGVLDGESKLEVCTSSCRAGIHGAGAGEFNVPEGIALDSKGDVFVADRGNHRVQEFNPELAWVRNLTQLEEHEGPFYLTVDPSNNIWVTYSWDNKIGEFNSEGKLLRIWGSEGSEPGKLSVPYGVTVGPEGNVWVPEYGNSRVQVFTQTGEYLYGFGAKGSGAGQFNQAPHGIAFTSPTTVYVLDSGVYWENTGNSRVEKWTIPTPSKAGVHVAQTIYYSKAANSQHPSCGEHPEWAGMPCQSQPAEQPGTSGLPNLPVSAYSYNMYFEPTKTVSTVGVDTRTTTTTYDEAGRPESTETTSTVGAAVPKVTDKYSSTTGLLVEQKTSTESLKSEYNALGQLTSYTDADGNTSTYEYEKEGDYRLKHINDGKGTQTYEYDGTTGLVKELTDSAAGTFTASYDVEGKLIGEGYPNAMSASYTTNSSGQVTSAQYVKTAHCAKTCPETWYSDSVVPSIHGQWSSQQSELSGQSTNQSYTYDEVGRLVQTTDNVGGKNCITRIYGYDEETNRLSLTTRAPLTGGACASEGGETQSHTYDSANRMMDAGTKYDSFGNTIELPAADAGGTALTSTYYQDNQVASQTQGTQTIGYQLDPAGRTREIVSTGKITATEIQHYAGPSGTVPAWTGELSTNYTRYITGISGALVAIQHNSEKPVLQLANLHGDEIATATDTETTTSLASTIAEASEYGVPATEAPPKYSWLGAHQTPTALPSGVTTMGVRTYIPQLGRFLQADPRPGGSANAYAYTYGDPINSFDFSGEYTVHGPSQGLIEGTEQSAAKAVEEQIAINTAIREEAERKAAEAAAAYAYAMMLNESPYGEEYWEGEEEYWEEEGEEWEYAAMHQGSGQASEDPRIVEEGLFYEPSGEAAAALDSLPQGGASNDAINRAIRLCESQTNAGHAACSRFVNYVLKMSRKTMRRLGGWLLAGGTIDGELPIPNPVASLLAKASGAYLQGLGQAMLGAAQMRGEGGCFLSFHTFKLPVVGDTGVPDGAYAAQCH
jgi:RHS repeat-associated protein